MTSSPQLDPNPSVAARHVSTDSIVAVLKLTGMHCDSCVALIEETLAECSGVRMAAVDLEMAEARVTFDPNVVTVDALCAAVLGEGYGVSPAPGTGS